MNCITNDIVSNISQIYWYVIILKAFEGAEKRKEKDRGKDYKEGERCIEHFIIS